MSRLYQAIDTELDRPVAIKKPLDRSTLRVLTETVEEAVELGKRSHLRIQREASVLARLDHPAIVTLLESRASDLLDPYFVMTWLEGMPLDRILAHMDHGRAPWALRADLLRRLMAIAEALQFAHSRALVHRDVKPANIIVGNRGQITLIDWGIAAADGELNDGTLTRDYAPSEQSLPVMVHPSLDVYAFGATAFHVVTGVPPTHASIVGSAWKRADGVPDEVVFMVATWLDDDPAKRPTMNAVVHQLQQYFAGEDIDGHRYRLATRASRSLRRHPVGWTLAAAAATAVAITVPVTQFLEQQELRASAADARAEAERARAQQIQLSSEKEVERVRAENAETIADKQRELLVIVGELTNAYLDKTRDQQKIDRLRGLAKSKEGEISKLEDEKRENTKTITDLGGKLSSALEDSEALRAKISGLSDNYGAATDANFAVTDANFALTDANFALTDANFALEAKLDGAVVRGDQLAETVVSLEAQIDDLKKSNAALKQPDVARALELLLAAIDRELPQMSSGDQALDDDIRRNVSAMRTGLEELRNQLRKGSR